MTPPDEGRADPVTDGTGSTTPDALLETSTENRTQLVQAARDLDAAQDLDARIDLALGDAFALLAEAYRTGAWVALGFDSWPAYCATKADVASRRIPRAERLEIFGQFRDAGMSNREIAAAVGVSSRTVDRALASPATNDAEVDHEGETPGSEVVVYQPPPPATNLRPAGPKPKPVVMRRKPFTDQALLVAGQVRKAGEQLERLMEDDRYPRQRDAMIQTMRGSLRYTEGVLARLAGLPAPGGFQ